MEVRPKAAGALWTRMAIKITTPSELLAEEAEEVDEAPRAMPSARAWIRRPIVVGFGREEGCEGMWWDEEAVSGSIVERGMWWVWPLLVDRELDGFMEG